MAYRHDPCAAATGDAEQPQEDDESGDSGVADNDGGEDNKDVHGDNIYIYIYI